jgi:glycosyltransferase involved in cell wall biosynthesis
VKILIHSNAPMVPTGYGQQVRLLAPKLRELGHEVAVSAFYGVAGAPISWDGITIYPAGAIDYGLDVMLGHAKDFGADLILTLMDFWKMAPIARELKGRRIAAWLPNDCTPLGRPDAETLALSGAVPIAMSQFGVRNLQEAGYPDPLYVPHAIDTAKEFAPLHEGAREALRKRAGAEGLFVAGMNAANRDAARKAFPEQLRAFARFNAEHPDSVLFLHTEAFNRHGLNIVQLIEDMGLAGKVGISEQYGMVAGMISPDMLCDWYNSLDVLLNCSYAEGFGIPVIEAQACGTPVIVTNDSATAELRGPSSWAVEGSEWWNPVHRAWWRRPTTSHITRRLNTAYEWWSGRRRPAEQLEHRRQQARDFALDYDIHKVVAEHWVPVLKRLEEM